MSRRILILRPEPGASETAGRAAELGLDPIVSPLFTIVPVAWDPPDPARFDAILLTSANAARHGGRLYAGLACYAVGEATAAAARQAGYRDIRIGLSNVAAVGDLMAKDGIERTLHLCGVDRKSAAMAGLIVEERAVYAAEPVPRLSEAARLAVAEGTAALLHSPRAAGLFAALAGDRKAVRIAAISDATAAAAGEGWALKAVAAAPRDEALLELAVELCQTDDNQTG